MTGLLSFLNPVLVFYISTDRAGAVSAHAGDEGRGIHLAGAASAGLFLLARVYIIIMIIIIILLLSVCSSLVVHDFFLHACSLLPRQDARLSQHLHDIRRCVLGNFTSQAFDISLRCFCAYSSSPQISAILFGHFTGENYSPWPRQDARF